MEDGVQILLYVVAGVIWVITSVMSNKKKKEKRTSMPSSPLPSQPSVNDFETLLKEEQVKHIEGVVEEFVEEKKEKVSKTFFDRDPYKDNLEHKEKKRLAKLKVIVPEEKKGSASLNITEIDWTKAVIYSEILRPRF